MKVEINFHTKESKPVFGVYRNKVKNTVDKRLEYKKFRCHVVTSPEPTDLTCVTGLLRTTSVKSEQLLSGPASSIISKNIIYPCDIGGCFIECGCPHCQDVDRSKMKKEQLFDHHNRYHHAPHLNCDFCVNLLDSFPSFVYISYEIRTNSPTWKVRVAFPTYQFQHIYGTERESLEDMLKCEDCNKTFSQPAAKFRHVRAVHDVQSFKCKKCDKHYNRRDVLNRHIKTAHELETIECKECEETFKRSDFLERHIRAVHDCEEYKCEHCNKKFNRKDILERHQEKGDNECNECDMTFCSMRKLQHHFTEEHGLYECEICEKIFKKKSNLVEHNVFVAGEKCSICDKQFCGKKKLFAHITTAHAEHFECSKCGQKFSNRWLLHRHGKSKYTCLECDSIFCNVNSLKSHKCVTHKSV